jgi:chorismate mutase
MRLRTIVAAVARFAAATATVAACAAPACAASADTALTNVIALAAQRLALAEPVARWKWANGKPATDVPREQLLLAQIAKLAHSHHVDPAFAQQFFRDQIEASKDVQNALFAQWRETPPPAGAAPDLGSSTRPQLDRLTQSLLAALAQVEPQRNAADCPSRLAQSLADWKNITTFDAARSGALNRALGHVCTAGGVGATG